MLAAPAKASAPAQAVAAPAFAPPQKGLSNEQRGLGLETCWQQPRIALSAAPPLLRAKLAIGEPDDEYEREADRVAETVMRMPVPAVQRKPG